MNWKENIKQYPKLEELWQSIPEPLNLLFTQQIDAFRNSEVETEVKKLNKSDVIKSVCEHDWKFDDRLNTRYGNKCLKCGLVA